jgi:hypothetical protein
MRMRRNAHLPQARRNLHAYIQHLKNTEPQSWPTLLFAAWEIIAKELNKPDQARQTVIAAVEAAHTCAGALSARLHVNSGSRRREAVLRAAKRISTRIKRMPVAAQRALDDVVRREVPIDTESVLGFLNGCSNILASFPRAPLVVEIQDLLAGEYDDVPKDKLPIEKWPMKVDKAVETMYPPDRQLVEDGLSKLFNNRSLGPSALDVFTAIADSLEVRPFAKLREYVGDLHRAYVADVAEIWRDAGLKPTRSHLLGKPDHKSRFHHFLELVLRDHLVLGHRSNRTVPENRYAWLVSDEDLKTALADHLQKTS